MSCCLGGSGGDYLGGGGRRFLRINNRMSR